jgi:hypothetical protein
MRTPAEEFQFETLDSLGAASAVSVFHAADDSLIAEVHPPISADALWRLVAS